LLDPRLLLTVDTYVHQDLSERYLYEREGLLARIEDHERMQITNV